LLSFWLLGKREEVDVAEAGVFLQDRNPRKLYGGGLNPLPQRGYCFDLGQ
jgi:hypothetical protein